MNDMNVMNVKNVMETAAVFQGQDPVG